MESPRLTVPRRILVDGGVFFFSGAGMRACVLRGKDLVGGRNLGSGRYRKLEHSDGASQYAWVGFLRAERRQENMPSSGQGERQTF